MEKIAFVTSCCKTKTGLQKGPICNIYNGQMFNAVKAICKKNQFTMIIMSAKYGLLTCDAIIESYDEKLKKPLKKDYVQNLWEVQKAIQKNFDKIIALLPELYWKCYSGSQDFDDSKHYRIFDSRGIFGYNQILSQLKLFERKQFLCWLGLD